MKAVIIGVSGHFDLALSVRDRVPQVRFAAIAPGSDGEDARAVHRSHLEGIGAVYDGDFRVMLDREKPDVAVVAPVFNLQAPIAIECLQRGVPVFLEKPMALDLEELGRLRRSRDAAGVALCPMMATRYSPEFYAAYRAVREGLIGEPLLVTAQKSYRLGSRAWYYRTRASYGGTIPWVGIHAIDLIHWFSGGDIVDVCARHTRRENGGNGEMESSAACVFRLANSGMAVATCDFLRPRAASTHGDDRIRVAGSTGVVEVRDGEAMVTTAERPLEKLPAASPASIFVDFIGFLEGGPPPRITADEAFDICGIALKSRDAADTGEVVRTR